MRYHDFMKPERRQFKYILSRKIQQDLISKHIGYEIILHIILIN